MIRRNKTFTGLIVMLILALAASACQATPASAQAQTVTVTRGTITATVAASGNVAAKSQVTVAFQSSGQVKTINVKVGDQVKAGQVLASLDTTDLETAVTSAQASLAMAQAQLEQAQQGPIESQIKAAQASVASAQAAYQAAQAKAGQQGNQLTIDQNNLSNASTALSNAQNAYNNLTEFPRSVAPGKPNIPPAGQSWSQQKAALDNAQVDYNSAVATYQLDAASINNSGVQAAAAQLASAQAQLADLQSTPTSQAVTLAQDSVKQAQLSLQQAQDNLSQAQLVAPFDGTVAQVNIQPGQQVGSSTAAVVLADMSQLQAQVTVAETDLPNLKVGQTAQVTFDALAGQTFTGHVTKVALVGTSTQGVVNYPVTIAVDQTDSNTPIRPGMSATVAIVVQQRDNVLLVPNRAVKLAGKQRVVTVLVNGKESQVNVTLGLSNDTESEVTSGLNEGDVVVLPQTTTTTSGGGGGGGPRFIGPGGFGD